MELLHHEEVWRRIPPEEKIDMMARAQAKGVLAASIFVGVCSTVAVGLQLIELMWLSLLISPLVFQFAAGRCWRSLRPKSILEYLAARSAARRFAFTLNGRDLAVGLLMRGYLEIREPADEEGYSFENSIEKVRNVDVWVALFADALIMMSESDEGAAVEFSYLIDDKLEIRGESDPGEGDYSASRRIHFTYNGRKNEVPKHYTLTSKYPGALVVMEKQLRQIHEEAKIQARKRRDLIKGMPEDQKALTGTLLAG